LLFCYPCICIFGELEEAVRKPHLVLCVLIYLPITLFEIRKKMKEKKRNNPCSFETLYDRNRGIVPNRSEVVVVGDWRTRLEPRGTTARCRGGAREGEEEGWRLGFGTPGSLQEARNNCVSA